MTRVWTFIALAVCLLTLSSCAVTRIGQIEAHPLYFRNRTVHVEGIVTQSAGAFNIGGYQIADGSGRIFVLSTRGVPPKGSRVRVTGNVVNGVSIGPRAFGTAIQAHDQRVRY